MSDPSAPIGVFDSGVGGLTVLRALRRALPSASFLYLGDTARLPYGTKSAATVTRYSEQCAAALIERGIGCLVVACNTASAFALSALERRYADIPVIGVIEPGAAAAVAASASQRIAVIGTEATVAGGAYQAAIRRLNARAEVSTRACSLFVALAEEGWTEGPLAEAVARRYLGGLFEGEAAPDTLVLGCTHFPALETAIRAVLPPGVRLVDSAATTAAAVERRLGADSGRGGGAVRWLATDGAARFARVGSLFLGEPLAAGEVEIVDL
ncbi:MAG: glutamate racemase [Gammaproteobacteria bacterium]|nr:glutamate racemase [Gammaproteobacteria bacterium]